jgi:hypothetical protein
MHNFHKVLSMRPEFVWYTGTRSFRRRPVYRLVRRSQNSVPEGDRLTSDQAS